MEHTTALVIYSLQIMIFQFYAQSKLSQIGYQIALGKNRSWIAENPAFLSKYPPPKGNIQYVLGACFLVILVYGYIVASKHFISVAHYGSIWAFAIQGAVIDWLRTKRIAAEIPARTERKAGLTPRTFSRFISKKALAVLVGLVLSVVVLWAVIFLLREPSDVLLYKALSHAIVLLVLGGTLFYALHRRPMHKETEMDSQYRKMEMWAVGVVMGFFCIGAAFDLATILIDPALRPSFRIFSDYAGSLGPMAAFVWFLNSRVYKVLLAEGSKT